MGWGYAVGAGLNIIGSALDYDRQKALDRDERAFQSAEAEKAYQRQLDFWDKQNEYNLPENQRKRLEDAGYNILDLMRNGSAMQPAGGLSSVAPAGSGRGSSAPLSALAEGAIGAQNALSQRRLVDSQASLNDQRAKTEFYTTALRRLEALDKKNDRESKIEADWWREAIRESLRGMKSTNENIEARTATERARELAEQTLAQLRSSQIDTEKTKQALNNASAHELEERAKQYASLIGLQGAEADYYVQLARKISTEADKAEYAFEQLKNNGLDVTQGGITGTVERVVNITTNKFVQFLSWLVAQFGF